MTSNVTDMIFDDSFYFDPRAMVDLQYMRLRVSNFECVVRTHCFDINTLLENFRNVADPHITV